MKPLKERNPVIVAVVGLVILLVLGTLAYRAGDLPIIGGGTTYAANFSESAGLNTSNEVRVAGVKVGNVTGVFLDGDHVEVTFRVKNVWIGNASRVSIMIKTLLGAKYLSVDPLGDGRQNPSTRIPLSRTTSPYDVSQAFNGLGETFGQIDAPKLQASLEAIAGTFKNTPPNVRKALTGLSALSKVVSSRDTSIARLLEGTKQVTGTLSAQSGNFEALLKDGNLLLGEIQSRRDAIHALLTGTADLAQQLSGLVQDNQHQIGPMLTALDQVTSMLQRNETNLDHALQIAGPYYRLVTNAVGNGRWFDAYLCGLVPRNYLPPNTPPKTGCMSPKQGGGS
jgi:phospholipid/cholesterol/gamma-HCH transport system substrate-binding protein